MELLETHNIKVSKLLIRRGGFSRSK